MICDLCHIPIHARWEGNMIVMDTSNPEYVAFVCYQCWKNFNRKPKCHG